MTSITTVETLPGGWLRNARFDLVFSVGITIMALAAGVAVVWQPKLFALILVADLWLLGYHHVIATFTRMAFDRASLRKHAFLVFGLPPIVFTATAALGYAAGLGAIATLYLYWQWFHYMRQSWGIARAYGRKAPADCGDPFAGRLFMAGFYLVPLWGILHRSAQSPDTFLGLPVYTLPVPMWLANAVGVAAVATCVVWVVDFVRRGAPGLTIAQMVYLASHFVVFVVGYVVIRDITYGWLVINVWHNAQYILFVWMQNARRFQGGVNPNARFISWLSQTTPGRMGLYLIVCTALSTVVYWSLSRAISGAELWAIPMVIVIFQAVNFHHYLVDGLIWRSKGRYSPNTAA